MNEDCAGNDNASDFTTMAIAIDVGFFLAGYIGFVAKCLQVFAAEFFTIALNDSNIPLGNGYASGKRLAHMLCVLRC